MFPLNLSKKEKYASPSFTFFYSFSPLYFFHIQLLISTFPMGNCYFEKYISLPRNDSKTLDVGLSLIDPSARNCSTFDVGFSLAASVLVGKLRDWGVRFSWCLMVVTSSYRRLSNISETSCTASLDAS